nr:Rpn family recombination-promoting nuclease/putative transposase [Saprospiraceae bacterium]
MNRTLISFDWAVKKLLRQKANYDILEGFLAELIKRDIVIKSILESESNKEQEDDKYNQVDLLCEDVNGDLIIIEVQFYEEVDYFQRVLFSTSKVITEHMSAGSPYETVRKVYSVNILYFDIGSGTDYVYRGRMNFTGLHRNDQLELGQLQQEKFAGKYPADIFPEIILIKVNNFNDVAKDTLDEWIFFLKNTELPKNYSAKGLRQVEQKLKYDKMDTTTKQQYDEYLTSVRVSKSMLETAEYKGRQEGRQEEKQLMVLKLFELGQKVSIIAKVVEMEEEEVLKILRENGRAD